ncbi:MAG: serine/threonine-protein kinase, partial [Thermoanaerobaculia bacterium]|nr:serine/threonine-protein kinase [Thermoanaerobaculia bacterium]
PDRLRLLLDEVRTARQVTHSNVCRVHDVDEYEGQHFICMEYVDGEDLSSLLRRIGRLPRDKAIEIARQLCAALDAAHGEGVLHRDLKPANVMLDGRGRVKLTDFGLAAVAEVRAGTPVYMAPEQLAGDEVSVRSDVYSLGLVLHELFTGKRVFEAESLADLSQRHLSAAESLTTTSGLDPAIDRVIRRCLEHDPAKRPPSALAVAAGLPGADPLAAALAAGETPSPEMVAEAGGEGSLSLRVAVPILVTGLLAAAAVGVLQSRTSLVSQVPFETPPVVLESRAREIVADLGHTLEAGDTASGFTPDVAFVQWLAAERSSAERRETLRTGRPASILFWWRASPQTMRPSNRAGPSAGRSISLTNPPATTPGMVSLQLDTLGRLVWLDVVPDRLQPEPAAAEATATESTDWSSLFEAMELDADDFEPVTPRLTPPHFADEQVAWEGELPEDPAVSLRIEAAALGGRPISLRTFTPYAPLEPPTASGGGGGGGGLRVLTIFTIIVVLAFIAVFLTVIFG